MALTTHEQLAILDELISDAQFDMSALVRELGQVQKTIDVLQVKIAAYKHANSNAPENLTPELNEAKKQFSSWQADIENLRSAVEIYEDYRENLLV